MLGQKYNIQSLFDSEGFPQPIECHDASTIYRNYGSLAMRQSSEIKEVAVPVDLSDYDPNEGLPPCDQQVGFGD